MKWFRMYSDALDDPKVQRLPGETFKAWVNLLCLANDGEPRGTLPCLSDIAFRLRMTPQEAAQLINELTARGLLDSGDDATLQPHNWNQRQYRSDDINARVQKHRAKRDGNVTETLRVTPPDTDTDTDTNAPDCSANAPAGAHAREGFAVGDVSDGERKVVALVKAVRGMASVPDAAIAHHLHEVVSIHDPPVSERALIEDGIRFRDHWNDKRATSPAEQRWRGWRNAITRWFTRTRDAPALRPAVSGYAARAEEPYDAYRERQLRHINREDE